MRSKRVTYNPSPSKPLPPGAPAASVLDDFAKRLSKRMTDADLSQTDLARKATLFMPKGEKISRDLISGYVNARHMPAPRRLAAIAEALGCTSDDLLPHRGFRQPAAQTSPLDIRDIGEGRVWLQVNQAVEKKTGLKIMSLLLENE
jgi:transcriptional regulator with XRE-family HTH domain